MKLLIFSRHEIDVYGIYRKKVNFLCIFSVKGEKLKFFPSHFSLSLLGLVRLVGIILSLHLENGL